MKFSENDKIFEILNKYSDENNYTKVLLDLQSKVDNADIVVPFLGTQGAGKSTMINSLIEEEILPNEADETTCIPVEIRYEEEAKTMVYFEKNKSQVINNNKESIAQYVDNNFNPGNEKKVSHIVIYRPYEILKTGLVIVDLPGVGSLTKANQETTVEYIKNLATAIFVISTTPPILKSEAKFIANVWKNVNSAIFVQNIWDDNSSTEIEDGLNHNKGILNDIAETNGINYEGEIIAVNAYAAAKGFNDNNSKLISKSNIDALRKKLKDFSINYKETMDIGLKNRALTITNLVKEKIQVQIDNSSKTKEELVEEYKKAKDVYEEENYTIKTMVRRLEDRVYEASQNSKKYATELSRLKGEKLRASLYELIDKGLTDGSMLNDAFKDLQVEYCIEACEEATNWLNNVCEDLQKDFNELEDCVFESNQDGKTISFEKKGAFKWEKIVKTGIMLGADIGGVIAFGAVVGAVAGPVGVVAGVAAGLAISLIGMGFGSLVKNGVTAARAKQTKTEIEPKLEMVVENIEQSVKTYSRECFDKINETVKNLWNVRKQGLEEIEEDIKKVKYREENIEQQVKDMKEDLSIIKEWENNYERL